MLEPSERRATTAPFARDPGTWAAYLLLGFYSFLLNGLGVLLPFLRTELGLSYLQASLHSSAFAVGLLIASVTADRLGSRFGRRTVLWGGALGMSLGALTLALAPGFAWSLLGALLMGTLGSFTLVQVSANLSERHGDARGRALAEANALASLCALLAPLAVSGAVLAGFGWRAALLAALSLLIAAVATSGWRASSSERAASERSSTLPSVFWHYWILLLLNVAVEFCVIFWAADFLRGPGGLRPEAASAAVGAFLGAMLVGRSLGSLVLRGGERVLSFSLLLTLAGFLVYWFVDVSYVRVGGLFITGLGVANLYPATLTRALAAVPKQAEKASARASLASGVAILGAPLLLGTLADTLSLARAQALVPLLVLLALLALGIANHGRQNWRGTEA